MDYNETSQDPRKSQNIQGAPWDRLRRRCNLIGASFLPLLRTLKSVDIYISVYYSEYATEYRSSCGNIFVHSVANCRCMPWWQSWGPAWGGMANTTIWWSVNIHHLPGVAAKNGHIQDVVHSGCEARNLTCLISPFWWYTYPLQGSFVRTCSRWQDFMKKIPILGLNWYWIIFRKIPI